MKNILKIGLLLSAFALFFVFSGCGEDEAVPEDFKTLEEAETALFETEEDIYSILDQLFSATDIAMTFDGSYPNDFGFKTKHGGTLRKTLSPRSFGYNAQTGYWTFDTTATELSLTLSANGKIRFTPRDPVTGLPNESTDLMEYDMTASMTGADEGGYIDLTYKTALDLAGIAGFRDSTGNATINGSESVDFTIDVTLETDHFVGEYDHSYKINIVVSPTLDYPQSGVFEFTIKREFNTSAGFGQNFFIDGSITFDGSNIAVLEFGGYTFHINLDGPYIVEFAV